MRELLAVVWVERNGVSVKALAEVPGRSRVTVSSWVSRGAARRAGEKTFEKLVDEIDSRIATRQL
jgi:transposase